MVRNRQGESSSLTQWKDIDNVKAVTRRNGKKQTR